MDLADVFSNMALRLKMVSEEMKTIAKEDSKTFADKMDDKQKISKAKNMVVSKEGEKHNSTLIVPVTRIYRNKQEIIEAKKNPKLSRVMEALNDIFKG